MEITEYIIIFFAAMIPFIEYLFMIPIGIIFLDLNPVIVTVLAITGNILSLLLFIVLGDKLVIFFHPFKRKTQKPFNQRKERLETYYQKYGAIGLSFLGCFLLSSQLTAGGMVPLGISPQKTFIWTSITVIIFAVTMSFLSVFADNWIRSMFQVA